MVGTGTLRTPRSHPLVAESRGMVTCGWPLEEAWRISVSCGARMERHGMRPLVDLVLLRLEVTGSRGMVLYGSQEESIHHLLQIFCGALMERAGAMLQEAL